VLRTHHGSWQVKSAPGGSRVIAQHSIQLNRDACEAAFGETDIRLHKQRIKELVTLNSGTTIEACTRWIAARQSAVTAPAEPHEAVA
jgi:hypothetical protein